MLIQCQNKELEATEERKRKAKQLEMQRKEVSRSGRNAIPRTPVYPTYTPNVNAGRSTVNDTYDSYEAEKNKSLKYVASGSIHILSLTRFIEPVLPRERECS